MDLKFEAICDKYFNVKDVLKNEFKISNRLFVKLRNNKQIFLNRQFCKWL